MTPLLEQTRECLAIHESNYAERFRTSVLAQLIDRSAQDQPAPNILALEAGRLPELNHSYAFPQRLLGHFIAIDSNPAHVEANRRDLASHGVQAIQAPLHRLIDGELSPLYKFNLIYAPTCCDQLEQPQAGSLTHHLWNMLAPGGRLVLSNTTKSTPSPSGHRIPRSPHTMRCLLDNIRASELASAECFEDSTMSYTVLIATKS